MVKRIFLKGSKWDGFDTKKFMIEVPLDFEITIGGTNHKLKFHIRRVKHIPWEGHCCQNCFNRGGAEYILGTDDTPKELWTLYCRRCIPDVLKTMGVKLRLIG